MKKKRKIRTDFRKNRQVRTRQKDLTGQYSTDDALTDEQPQRERIRAKGDLSRKRTVAGAEIAEDDSGTVVLPDIDRTACQLGRVLKVQGLISVVAGDDGRLYRCATRRLLKTLSTDQRHVVAAGDRVWFRVAVANQEAADKNPQTPEPRPPTSSLQPTEGIIERVEPRHGVISRTSRGRQHVIVANVDQLVIVASAAEPRIKPHLIDRLLVTAERARIRPLICINKIDLISPARLMPLVGVYAQLGYNVLLTSATTGQGIERLRGMLTGQASVLTGQSGVGKSTLLNAVQPGLDLLVREISADTQKGRHTTTTAELIRLKIAAGQEAVCPQVSSLEPRASYVVDTPGIRQFQLWDVIPEEVAGFFRDIRPYVSHCRYADCTHTHEDECAVQDAVADGWIDTRRYESYMRMRSEE